MVEGSRYDIIKRRYYNKYYISLIIILAYKERNK